MLKLSISDHWQLETLPSFALLECIRRVCENNSMTCKLTFPKVFECLEFPCPTNINGLVAKIKRHVSHAVKEGRLEDIAEQLPRHLAIKQALNI